LSTSSLASHFALQTHEDGEETSIKYKKGRMEPVAVEAEEDDESPFAELPRIFCTIWTAAAASIAQTSGSLTTAHATRHVGAHALPTR
jgi:hypothetical protein